MKTYFRIAVKVLWFFLLVVVIRGVVMVGPAVVTVIQYRAEIEDWAKCQKEDPSECNRAKQQVVTVAYKTWQYCMQYYPTGEWLCGSPILAIKGGGILPSIANWSFWSSLQQFTRRE